MRVGDLIDRIGRDLNDPDHRTWPEASIRDWLSEAAMMVVRHKPGQFPRTVVLELEPCLEYHPVCPCEGFTIGSVLGQSTREGALIAPLTFRSEEPGMTWTGGGPRCPTGGPHALREFSITPDGSSIRVWPPVPPGEEVFVSLRCDVPPDMDADGAEVPASAAVAMVQWVLYRAKGVDAENNPIMMYSAYDHKDSFHQLMGVSASGSRRRMTETGRRNAGLGTAS